MTINNMYDWWVRILTILKIISKLFNMGLPQGHFSDMLVNASYYDDQEYIWFMGGDLNHFQDNL